MTARSTPEPFQVRLLGGFSILGPGRSAVELPTQKAKALFAMIALAGGNGIDRATAASWLWSRGSDVQARTNLRQTLASIRKALSGEVECIESSGTTLRIAADTIEADFEVLQQGSFDLLWAGLDCLGPLLEGIRIDEPDFQDWLENTRASLQNQLSAALFMMVETKQAEGDYEQALRANIKLLTLDEFDEGAHRQAMRIYTSMGAPAKALRHYDTLTRSLDKELGIAPSATTQELMVSLRRTASLPRSGHAETVSKSDPDARHVGNVQQMTTVVVLPFAIRGAAGDSTLGAEMAEEIAMELGRFATLKVSMGEAQSRAPASNSTDQRLNYMLEGGIRQSAGHVRVTVQLLDGSTRNLVWAERYERAGIDEMELLDDISACVAAAIPGRVQAEVAERSARQSPDTLGPHELMLRGKQLRDDLSAFAMLEARDVLKKAVRLDPKNARAQMYLSDTYVIDGWLGLNDEAGARLALTHARLAVAADPKDVFVQDHLGFAFLSNAMWQAGQAQIDSTLSKIGNEIESNAWCGYALSLLGDHRRAEIEVLRSTARDPLPPATFGWIRGQVFSFNGRYGDAVEELMGAASLNSLSKAFLAGAYAQMGRKDASFALEDYVETRRSEFACRQMEVPAATVTGLASGYRSMWKRRQDWDHIAIGLKKAGLPTE
ncbi:BTAD domain-containing putative transcriptional regulator [Boseongicola aestuarii]|nr:BTAD domain-containing putative transcriptional regulator [Boseongicola aestuarii]